WPGAASGERERAQRAGAGAVGSALGRAARGGRGARHPGPGGARSAPCAPRRRGRSPGAGDHRRCDPACQGMNNPLLERPLPREVFRLLREAIYEYCGLFFDDDATFLVQRRLLPRLEALSLSDFSDYYRYLRSATPETRRGELDEIVERVTTNE